MDFDKAQQFMEENQEGLEKLAQNERFQQLSEKFNEIFKANGIEDPNNPLAMQKIAALAMKDPQLLGELMEFAQLLQENTNMEDFQK